MNPELSLDPNFLAFGAAGIVLMVVLPLIFGFVAQRRLGVSWRYFLYGALVFFVSQMVLRIPLVTGLQFVLGPALVGSQMLTLAFGGFLALTAALFEGVGRYLGYRWLMGREEKTWNKGVMYGLGHGGLESMLLIAGIAILQVVGLLSIASAPLDTLPPEARDQVVEQFALINALPAWAGIIGAWERVWAIAFHVAMSVVVLQVFRRGSIRWLWYAVGLHALMDFAAPVLIPNLLSDPVMVILAQQLVITLIGLVGIWIAWRLRDDPTPPVEQPAGNTVYRV